MRRFIHAVTVTSTRMSSESVPRPMASVPYGARKGTSTSMGVTRAVWSSNNAMTCSAPSGIQSTVVYSCSERSARLLPSQSSTAVRSAMPVRSAIASDA